VKRWLIRSNAFIRDARRLAKKDPQAVEPLLAALALLEEDAFHPRLKAHKLKGDLQGSRACSFGYDMRIVFELSSSEMGESILLQSVGTHDEVYRGISGGISRHITSYGDLRVFGGYH
jgi:addiction module RelE/StbE family toxin